MLVARLKTGSSRKVDIMEKRRCDYCEYYCKRSSYSPAKCLFNPPRVSGEHNTGKFPDTHDDHFCSKWEPKWHENSSIQEA